MKLVPSSSIKSLSFLEKMRHGQWDYPVPSGESSTYCVVPRGPDEGTVRGLLPAQGEEKFRPAPLSLHSQGGGSGRSRGLQRDSGRRARRGLERQKAQWAEEEAQQPPWPVMEMEKEFEQIDKAGSWAAIYQDIRHEASDFPCRVAKLPKNKNRNRYRDVSPFDHSRIKLHQEDNDYINASLIKMEEAQRSYILTQGPLPNTCGHFWEMVWEQKSRGVVMLNRVMEKGSDVCHPLFQVLCSVDSSVAFSLVHSCCGLTTLGLPSPSDAPAGTAGLSSLRWRPQEELKCAQYWPQKEEKEMIFEDTNLKLTLISEDIKSYYTVRQLELENLTSQETREILHFHYTTWPDFGVPESPASFLNFLFKVRESGSLSLEHGPIVVHCSAGIGRSGTFCLADTCLLLMDKRKDPSSVDIKKVLLEMRKFRMGLIQTADQLRFSYLAVIEGAKYIMGDSSVQVSIAFAFIQEQWKELSHEDLEPPPEHVPPPPRPPKRILEPHNGKCKEFFPNHQWVKDEPEEDKEDGPIKEETRTPLNVPCSVESMSQDTEVVRRRVVGADPAQREPPPLKEEQDRALTHWKPFLVNMCMATVLTAGAYLCYRYRVHVPFFEEDTGERHAGGSEEGSLSQ
ncbi:Tyrosine-protein phosphatase, non-receptor type 1-like protein [Camelus ferus]|nr:Tyrosine-protein phosphatase, non-receptor type 1-like protein [Camelus ferus]